AGARPKRTPVASDSTNAKPMTRGDGAALIGMLCWSGKASASSACAPRYETARPSRPPVLDRSTLSVSNWRTMRLPLHADRSANEADDEFVQQNIDRSAR